MTIKLTGSGGAIKITGTGGSIKFSPPSGGGGGPTDPATLSNIAARYLASDAINYGYQLDLPENQDRTPAVSAAGGFSYEASSEAYNGLAVTGWTSASGAAPGWGGANTNKLMLPAYSKARTVYFVGDMPNSSVNTVLFSYGTNAYGGSPAASGFFQIVAAGGEIKIRSYSYDEASGMWTNRDSQAQSISSGVPFVLSYSYAEGTDVNANTMYINGTAASGTAGTSGLMYTGADGGDPVYSRNGVIQFGQADAPAGPNVKLAELFVFSSAHNATTRQGVESFLMSKYAI